MKIFEFEFEFENSNFGGFLGLFWVVFGTDFFLALINFPTPDPGDRRIYSTHKVKGTPGGAFASRVRVAVARCSQRWGSTAMRSALA